jgi:hypothetical protein
MKHEPEFWAMMDRLLRAGYQPGGDDQRLPSAGLMKVIFMAGVQAEHTATWGQPVEDGEKKT